MAALGGWGLVLGVVATLLLSLLVIRWVPQIAGRLVGARAKLVMLLIGFGIICFVCVSIYSAHQDICSAKNNDGINCDTSQIAMIGVLFAVLLVVVSQIRFVIAACATVRSRREA
jgi:hypothetical protein